MNDEFLQSWKFVSDGLRGYISGGDEHGVELSAGADEEPVTRRMCLNVEHYLADTQPFGEFVPRHEAAISSRRTAAGEIQVSIDRTAEWPVSTKITFDIPASRTLEAEYEFTFHDDIPGFEAFISNYFHDQTPPFLRLDGQWVQPEVADSEHRFWVAEDGNQQAVRDRYPSSPMGLDGIVSDARFEYPLMITPVPGSDATVVHVVEPEECVTLSINRTYNAHDFSLVGRDVTAGESVTCRAWMRYAALDDLDGAIDIYDRFVDT